MKVKNNTRTTKHKPPSRIRYEERNPVFSIRMPQAWHNTLTAFLQENRMDRKTFMALALNKIKVNYGQVSKQGYEIGHKDGYKAGLKDGEAEGFKTGREQGKKEGYEQGKKDWAIWVTCYYCKEPVYVPPGTAQHEYMRNVMSGELRHDSCPPEIKLW